MVASEHLVRHAGAEEFRPENTPFYQSEHINLATS